VILVNLISEKKGSTFSRPGYLLSDTGRVSHSSSFAQFTPKINFLRSSRASSRLPGGTEGALLWELVRLFDSGQPKTESILQYLAKVEAREINPHLADDIRIAWLTVLHAASGVCDAWGFSFWQFFGKTYPKALLAWAERDEVNRKALERCAEMVRAESTYTREGRNKGEVILAAGSAEGEQRPTSGLPARLGVPERRERDSAPEVPTLTHETGESRVSPANLYESARQFLSLPPKKPSTAAKQAAGGSDSLVSKPRFVGTAKKRKEAA
jgi:hypothetical protein